MRKKLRGMFSVLTACAVSAASLAALPVNAVGNVNIPSVVDDGNVGIATGEDHFMLHCTEAEECDYYEVHKPDEQGDIVLDMHKIYSDFDCCWEGTNEVEFLVGMIADSDIDFGKLRKRFVTYEAEIDSEDGYGFGVAFRCKEKASGKAVEVHILEAYSGLDVIDEKMLLGSLAVSGVEYNVYRAVEDTEKDRDVLTVARAESLPAGEVNGYIDIKGICEELNEDFMGLTEIDGAQFYVRAVSSEGSVSLNENELISTAYNDGAIAVSNSFKRDRRVFFGGLSYSFKADGKTSGGDMQVNPNGSAECGFDNVYENAETLFKKGTVNKKGEPIQDYTVLDVDGKVLVDTSDEYAVGVYGCLAEPMTEIFVVQESSKDFSVDGGEFIDNACIDGNIYEVYRKVVDGREQLWSVRQGVSKEGVYEAEVSVDLLKHIGTFKDAGFEVSGRFYEASAFAGGFGSGKGEFVLNGVDITMKSIHDEENIILELGNNAHKPSIERDGYYYDSCEPDGSLTLEQGGRLVGSCLLDAGNGYSFDMGIRPGYDGSPVASEDQVVISYDADVSAAGTYYICAEGGLELDGSSPATYYICNSSNYAAIPYGADYLGDALIGSDVYDIFVDPTHDYYDPNGYFVPRYYSIKKETDGNHTNVSGVINITDHMKAWADMGLDSGKLMTAYMVTYMYGEGQSDIVFQNIDISVSQKQLGEEFEAEDIVLFTSFLLGEAPEMNGKDFDLNGDGVWDSFDLIALRRRIAESNS